MRHPEFITHGLGCLILLYLPGHCALRWLTQRGKLQVEAPAFVIQAFVLTALFAYLDLIVHYFDFRKGIVVSFVMLAWAIYFLLRDRRREGRILWAGLKDPEQGAPLRVMAAALMGYAAMLYAGVPSRNYADVPMLRYSHLLPGDTLIPGLLARYMYDGFRPGVDVMFAGWQWSDRPPLQSGLALYAAEWIVPWAKGILPLTMQMAGMVAQLFWIPATWHLLHVMSVPRRVYRIVYGMALPTSFFFVNVGFIWPKLLAAGFAINLLAMALTFSDRPETRTYGQFALFGLTAVMAMLSHAGIAFFFLGLGVLLLSWRKARWIWSRQLLVALGVAFVCYAPWVAYQKLVEPPGDHLLKTHIGGTDTAAGNFGEIVKEAYSQLTLQQIWDHKVGNFESLLVYEHNYASLNDPAVASSFRVNQFFSFGAGLEFALYGLIALPLGYWLARKRQQDWPRHIWFTLGTCIVAIVVWLGLMYGPGTTVNHQGAYAINVLLIMLGGIGVGMLPPLVAWLVVAAQWAFFATLWVVHSPELALPVNPVWNVLGFAMLGVAIWMVPSEPACN